ncbi:MAG TPA: hypothetical protein VGB36_03515 [Gammaproteobacteria bacterium]
MSEKIAEIELRQRSEILAAARDYPYEIPRRSFVYSKHRLLDFDPGLCDRRTPVLAIGSNQSPARLAQKFGHDAAHVIPVQRATLRNFDVVYSAHISRYGAVPAMLQTSQGASVTVAVTWLDDAQLGIMGQSEVAAANYAFALLENLSLQLDDGSTLSTAHAYVSSRGHLCHGGPVGLAAIHCEGRNFPAMTTAQALELVRKRTAPQIPADEFVLRLVSDDDYRAWVTRLIGADAVPFAYPCRILHTRA